jgi:hypothetical protein
MPFRRGANRFTICSNCGSNFVSIFSRSNESYTSNGSSGVFFFDCNALYAPIAAPHALDTFSCPSRCSPPI